MADESTGGLITYVFTQPVAAAALIPPSVVFTLGSVVLSSVGDEGKMCMQAAVYLYESSSYGCL